jgi:protein SCO1
MRRGFALLFACVVAAGIAALAAQTDGFRVVTSEGARRLDVVRAPRALPAVALTDQDGAAFSLADYRGRVVLIEFIYTSCPTICGLLGDEFRQVQDLLRREGEERRISLLSISFDVAHDAPPELKSYGERFGAKPPLWRIAVPSAAELPALLDSFGVVVIPDGWGGFTHNAAICVVDRNGRLARILDPEPAPRLLARLASLDL